jgi:hypothetical protein
MTNIKSLGVAAILFAALATPSYAHDYGVAGPYRTHHERAFGRYVPRNWYNSYAGRRPANYPVDLQMADGRRARRWTPDRDGGGDAAGRGDQPALGEHLPPSCL